MALSFDKQKALEIFNDFMQDSTAQRMLIQGPPGTGKTKLINELVESYINTNQVTSLIDPKTKVLTADNVVLAATTHKAKRVIIDNVTDDINSKYKLQFNTGTIHSVLGLRMFYNNNMELDYSLDERHSPFYFNSNNCLLIIDECSYVNRKLDSFINNQLQKSPQLKVVFVGDRFQGNPVKESESPVFSQYDYYAELSERFRFPNGGSIHQNSIMLENHIKGDPFKQLVQDEYYQVVGKQQFIDIVNTQIVSSKSNVDTRIVAYHNQVVKDLNGQIQSAKYGSYHFQVGQKLINNEAYINKHAKVGISNEKEVIIKEIDENPMTLLGVPCLRLKIHGFGCNFYMVTDIDTYKDKLKKAKQDKDWSTFFKLKESFIDLRPVWAMTSHKSQGSTFDNVIVDFNDMDSMRNKKDFPYLFNVATTRARNTVYIYRSDLP